MSVVAMSPRRLATCFVLASCAMVAAPSLAKADTCYIQPLPNVSSPWGFYDDGTPHRGCDYVAAAGTPIPAIADATVYDVVSGHACMGNIVILQHADGMYSSFSHLQSAQVSPGQQVLLGQTIATVGNTGSCSFGAHVHVVMSDRPRAYYDAPLPTIDPYAYIEAHPCGGESELLQQQPVAYAPPRTTDLNGDGRDDVCARASDGVHCYLAQDGGWRDSGAVLAWSNETGWDDVSNYATLRMGDIDGDGLADLCARSNTDVRCALSTGEALETASTPWIDGISDANGWGVPEYYTTLRLADVDGDGREDLCARDNAGFGCWISNGQSFERRVEGPRWSDAAGFTAAQYYGTLRMGDLNGDGRDDVCIRGAAGMGCAISDGDGFPTEIVGPAWSDAQGFDDAQYWSTLRMGDVNGDGREDLCIRTSADYRCALSEGTSFGATVIVAELSNASGWDDATNYRTFRMGDINADGAMDICARANAGALCWAWDGVEFVRHDGPEWSDARNWGNAQYFDTMRLADIDGDGRDDLCARAGAGWWCNPSRDDGFGEVVESVFLSDAGGWNGSPAHWSTIVSGGRCLPRAEECNGRDDDCDNVIDNGVCDQSEPGTSGGETGSSPPGDSSGGASDDTGHDSADTGHDGADTGPNYPEQDDTGNRGSGASGCQVGSGRTPLGGGMLLGLLAGILMRRRRSARG